MPRKPSGPSAPGRTWKVGDLAERTGLTVRTLHHYDAVGLLKPSDRTDSAHGSGHRLYTTTDVARLQQILSLKQLGFGLEQIREYLARPDYDPRRVVRLQLERVRGQSGELKRLEVRLAALSEALDKAETVSADEFLTTIEEMTMIEKYYTPEQLESLQRRREEVGEEVIRQAPQQWAESAGRRPRGDGHGDRADRPQGGGTGPPLVRAGERLHRWRPRGFPVAQEDVPERGYDSRNGCGRDAAGHGVDRESSRGGRNRSPWVVSLLRTIRWRVSTGSPSNPCGAGALCVTKLIDAISAIPEQPG